MTFDDIYRPFQRYFRQKRMRQFCDLFGIKDADRIVDVGGGVYNWMLIEQTPEVLIVNINVRTQRIGRFPIMKGDGRNLVFPDNSFDIAYSNSVIEHVGGWSDQKRFAEEIRRVAPRYYVQTPNRRFFIEPHLFAPFLHFLPRRLTRRLVRWCSVWGWTERPDQARVDRELDGTVLLEERQMRELFPDAVILHERFAGFSKSLIAVKV